MVLISLVQIRGQKKINSYPIMYGLLCLLSLSKLSKKTPNPFHLSEDPKTGPSKPFVDVYLSFKKCIYIYIRLNHCKYIQIRPQNTINVFPELFVENERYINQILIQNHKTDIPINYIRIRNIK